MVAAGGCASLSSFTATLEPTVIQTSRLVQPLRPPSLLAASKRDVDALANVAQPKRLDSWKQERGAKVFEGPQIPFFFESELGRAYLRSGPGRALARGEPPEKCPMLGAALDAPTPQAAAASALKACLERRGRAQKTCGCRLIAAENVLFAPAETFTYARAVSARLIPLNRRLKPDGPEAALIAEERYDPRIQNIEALTAEARGRASGLSIARQDDLAAGARRLWLIGLQGPVAGLDLDAKGGAVLTLLEGPRAEMRPVRTLKGRWRAEGFRRGRLAEQIALRGEKGDRLLLLIGYEPRELLAEKSRLLREGAKLF